MKKVINKNYVRKKYNTQKKAVLAQESTFWRKLAIQQQTLIHAKNNT